ncbi:hypothetical protein LVJ94_05945 [Pendulispora rubella]|uniref:Uncharacterized protein n=1 Tax=Pendulispora rubella TaxID=2741070 RepID=A0ABZ2L8X5_9BACT
MAQVETTARERVLAQAAGADPIASALVGVLGEPVATSSKGRAYLAPRAWERLRDGVPLLLGFGEDVLAASARLVEAVRASALPGPEKEQVVAGASVVRQVVLTAAITAPPDLWLIYHVLGFFAELGLLERLAAGEAIHPACCQVTWQGNMRELVPEELDTDLHFLLSRGFVEPYDEGFRIAGHPRVRETFERILAHPPRGPSSPASLWRRLFEGGSLEVAEVAELQAIGEGVPRRRDPAQNHWIPTYEELDLGRRLLPIVLGLRAAQRTAGLVAGAELVPAEGDARYATCIGAALSVLTAAGWLSADDGRHGVTVLGARGFARGPGPFGIVEAYRTYMDHGREILLHGRGEVWVQRGENVGASQDANRATFEQANDALDRFVRDTGFSYGVFIEHAIGRGEATRQRFARSGDALTYVGADLEDAAIDAAVAEQSRGALPRAMHFVRNADIGQPDVLLAALRAEGIEANGAAMLVGNGFHEVRNQTDLGMIEVFRGYERAGIVLLFTEENALSIDDLRATAWNTYHAGFKYVHEKSGQGLRPAEPNPRPARLGRPLRAAWSECARRAGYVRADAYCTRTRTVYPSTPIGGYNPSISTNHFFIPGSLARTLGIARPT